MATANMHTPKVPTLLIANRGEIAVRIMRSARAEGYRTAAIYSDADRDAAHVLAADIAVAIGGNTPQESYLDIDKVIAAAEKVGAFAVHPGYGFLSENAHFARACTDAGLQFIGPGAEVIELMGNKRQAKSFVAAAGVPCIPGYAAPTTAARHNDAELVQAAQKIGYPLMVKAADGGGGRGMRLVKSPEALPEQLRSARSEALNAFGSDEVILEKALTGARHIEIQIFADSHGNVIHLGERDCSVQRRHQKIIEECPSPAVDDELRKRMGATAVAAARACNYLGAGTVEFLLDSSGEFYFLEMNTRLQVEHPVTEMVTGLDLVGWQLAVARGEALPVTQEEIAWNGHAIEVRLYAEDPYNQFLPQSGTIKHWREPRGEGIRCDHAITVGASITPYYDPMLGKLIAWGQDREQARLRLARALRKLDYIGPKNNTPFLLQLLADGDFSSGNASTNFIDSVIGAPPEPDMPVHLPAVAAVLLHEHRLPPEDRRSGRANWRSGNSSMPLYYRLRYNSEYYELLLSPQGDDYRVAYQGETYNVHLLDSGGEYFDVSIDGLQQRFPTYIEGLSVTLLHDGSQWQFADCTHTPASVSETSGSGRLTAPMDGAIVEVRVEPQQQVKRGDIIAVMEAMKMEHPLKADRDGTVQLVHARPGDQVRGGQLLAQIETEAATENENKNEAPLAH